MVNFILFLLLPIFFVFGTKLSEKENNEVQRTCGLLNSNRMKRSTNGTLATREEAPWVAAIGIGPKDIYCSGVWISDRHVLTAAHCVNFVYSSKSKKDVYYPYVINAKNVDTMERYKIIEAFQIRKVHYPLLYLSDLPSTFGDIALVEIAEGVKPMSRPACLPKNEVIWGRSVAMFGYGIDVEHFNLELGVLRTIRSTTVPCALHGIYSICFNGFPYLPCHGDSGGPLITTINSRHTVNAIMSTINHRCKKIEFNDIIGYMNTATNVYHHLDWICHASGICPYEGIRTMVELTDSVVRAKYKSVNVTELQHFEL